MPLRPCLSRGAANLTFRYFAVMGKSIKLISFFGEISVRKMLVDRVLCGGLKKRQKKFVKILVDLKKGGRFAPR
jgi:hypothetical protein